VPPRSPGRCAAEPSSCGGTSASADVRARYVRCAGAKRGRGEGERREPCRPCICLVAAHFTYHHAALVEGRVIGCRALGALERNAMRGLRSGNRESDPSGQGAWKAKKRAGQGKEARQEKEATRQRGNEARRQGVGKRRGDEIDSTHVEFLSRTSQPQISHCSAISSLVAPHCTFKDRSVQL
jgi:hypothetical protein